MLHNLFGSRRLHHFTLHATPASAGSPRDRGVFARNPTLSRTRPVHGIERHFAPQRVGSRRQVPGAEDDRGQHQGAASPTGRGGARSLCGKAVVVR